MPEMDGVEKLQNMKALETDFNKQTPVIMLTANATRGARQEYLKAGFTDYLAKPFKEKDIQEILMKYLGEKMYHQKEDAECQLQEEEDVLKRLKEEAKLDVETGIGYCMNRDFYLEVLKDFANASKDTELEELFQQKDWNKYRTMVHALKSTSKTVGAGALSKEAEGLEMAAKEGDENYIEAHHE